MAFERFTGARKVTPARMEIGQIVIRKSIARKTITALRTAMRKAMRDHGMQFSVDEGDGWYAIRRDK